MKNKICWSPGGLTILTTYDVEGVFDWGLVVHGSEEVVLDREDHALLEELVAHQELLAGSGNIPVSVLNPHASESGLLDLQGDETGQVQADLGFLGWVDTWVSCCGENVEALVSYLVDHFFMRK